MTSNEPSAETDVLRARLAAVEAALPTPQDFERKRRHVRAIYTSATESGMLLGAIGAEETLANKVRAALAVEHATPPGTARTDGHYCLDCGSHQCEHAHATYPPEEEGDMS